MIKSYLMYSVHILEKIDHVIIGLHCNLWFNLWFNSLQPNDTMRQERSWSTLVQVLACCLMVPSHYLSQFWQIISDVLWYLRDGNFTGNAQGIYPWYEFEIFFLKIMVASPRIHWVDSSPPSDAYMNPVSIGSDNGLSPIQRQPII